MTGYLNTGTPGAGKTLFTLHDVEKRRITDNKAFYDKWVKKGSDPANPPVVRDVYYHNIKLNKSKLNWIELSDTDLEKWYELPYGSIFVFDECQEAFPRMSNTAERPRKYTEISKHRHRGFDMYFITQHPTFLDAFVRKNVEFHNHYMRPFGMQMVNKHMFKGVNDACDKTRNNSITEKLKFPTEVFSWYKSAEIHTVKRNIPTKVKMMMALPFILLGVIGYSIYYFKSDVAPAKKLTKTETSQTSTQNKIQAPELQHFEPASYVPRIPDLPWTAPRYDEVTKPTVAPQLIGCVIMRNECKCITQQGTTHIPSLKFCTQAIASGIFQDFGEASAKPPMQQNKPAESIKTSSQTASEQPTTRGYEDKPYVPYTQRFTNTPSLSTLTSNSDAKR